MKKNVAFTAKVGADLYNLRLPNSDEDYKTFFYPTFDDLYKLNQEKSKTKVTDSEDNEWHDVRKLASLLENSNETYLGVLFSDSVTVPQLGRSLYRDLCDNRENIARMNLPKLIDSSMGMFNQAVKGYKRELIAGNKVRAGKYAASAIRIANFVEVYARTDFKDFKKAIWFDDNDPFRDILLQVKAGEKGQHFMDSVLSPCEKVFAELKPLYKAQPKNEEMVEAITNLIKKDVRDHITKELGGN